MTQECAAFALQHKALLDEQSRQICRDREVLFARLQELPGIRAWPSRANFVLFRVPEGRGGAVMAGLVARKVLVKDLGGAHKRLRDCLRVTVGTPAEIDTFLAALEDVLAAQT